MSVNATKMKGGERVSEEERAYLLLPRSALAGCIALGIVRDTRGISMTDAQRFSHFPRSLYCTISWVKEGEVVTVEETGEDGRIARSSRLPDLSVSGPTLSATTMWSPGPAFGVTVAFYPDAWRALTGIDVEAIKGLSLPIDEVLAPDLVELVQEAGRLGDAEAGFRLLEDGLEPMWRARRPKGSITPFWLKDWTTALAVRAATSGAGKSLRQAQRRIRIWTASSQRDLDRQARVEQSYAIAQRDLAGPGVDLAQIAAEAGYADQSHMAREIREATGATPARIMRLIETEESYWIYRLMGARFQDAAK